MSVLESLRHFISLGGIVMLPLLGISLLLFSALFRLLADLLAFRKELAQAPDPSQTNPDAEALQQEQSNWNHHFERRLRFARIVTAATPLIGLLGTVAGMLKTFRGMGSETEANAADMMASGISEALITTETGLCIAIAGTVFIWSLRSVKRRLMDNCERTRCQLILSSPC